VTVSLVTGRGWTGSRGADRPADIHPELYQGPVPACLLPSAAREARPHRERPAARHAHHPTRAPREATAAAVEVIVAPPVTALPAKPPCRHCGNPTVRRGQDSRGRTRYFCRTCKRSFTDAPPRVRIETPPCPACGSASHRWGTDPYGNLRFRCASSTCGRGFRDRRKESSGRSCAEASKAMWARRSPEERSRIMKAAAATRLRNQGFDARSAASRKAQMSLSPEQRRERARKASAAAHAVPPEAKAARIAKLRATCAAKRATRMTKGASET